jgi:hypothetical protein
MGTKKRWQEVDARLMGLAVLRALANVEHGHSGEVEIDLEGRWVKIVTDCHRRRVVLFEIDVPPELHGHREVK